MGALDPKRHEAIERQLHDSLQRALIAKTAADYTELQQLEARMAAVEAATEPNGRRPLLSDRSAMSVGMALVLAVGVGSFFVTQAQADRTERDVTAIEARVEEHGRRMPLTQEELKDQMRRELMGELTGIRAEIGELRRLIERQGRQP